ncbi:MAG: DUF2062 domain-containing protein [Candidatus Omnitrophica bacterium]|jgi:uncharacterized protein (DUF2062 family)|nr:DUF2062 domain-containing protein [Candidatus Omnitrophota bacterium]
MKNTKKISDLIKRLININDTPQKRALGFGVGVFLGILPGTGPIAAIVTASFLHLNRASALLGSLLTNTWLSFVTFLSAVKIGSYLLRTDWQQSLEHWKSGKIILPVLLGYFIVALFAGLLGYLLALAAIKIIRKK